jgi:hypothetical protein
MVYKRDINNIAYSNEYINHRKKIINETYNQKYKTEEEIFELNNDIKIICEHYFTDGKYLTKDNSYCGYNKIYKNNILLHEYFNLYDQHFFCEYIKYSNELDYIFYKEDLYGYSVFENNSKTIFNYYPKATFIDQKETFIGTSIHYNKNNNIFAVEGCYWACPYDTFLIKIDNPMEQFCGLINIHEIIDPEYNKYDDINFMEWEYNDILLKIENKEILKLTEEEYMKKIIWIK